MNFIRVKFRTFYCVFVFPFSKSVGRSLVVTSQSCGRQRNIKGEPRAGINWIAKSPGRLTRWIPLTPCRVTNNLSYYYFLRHFALSFFFLVTTGTSLNLFNLYHVHFTCKDTDTNNSPIVWIILFYHFIDFNRYLLHTNFYAFIRNSHKGHNLINTKMVPRWG